jgi:anion-transporting  ArsA/GET3 family ATPase
MSKLIGETLKENPTEIETNLAAMELGTLEEMRKRWEALCNNPRMGITGRLREIQADEIPSFPGMDEIAALLVINQAALSDAFDLVVFGGTTIDSLINGITLRDMIRWIVRLVSGLDRGPGTSRSSQDVALLAGAGAFINTVSSAGLLQDLRVSLDRYCTWFDADVGTRVRLVMPAEELHFAGLRSIFHRFGLYGMQIDTLIARSGDVGIEDDV